MPLLKRLLKTFKKIMRLKPRRRKRASGEDGVFHVRGAYQSARPLKKAALRKKAKPPKAKRRSSPVRRPVKAKKIKLQRPPKVIKKAIPKAVIQKSKDLPVGEITHFFPRISVVVVKITAGSIAVGDRLRIQGKEKGFIQAVRSLQVESVDVKSGRKGQLVGLKVGQEARPGDKVFKIK